MITEQKVLISMEIIKDVILIKEAIQYIKDDIVVASNLHRTSISKESKRDNLDEKVQKVAEALWGPYVEPVTEVVSEQTGSVE